MQLKKLYRCSIAFLMGFTPLLANATVISSLENIQSTLVGRIGPVVAILGFVFAGFSYVSGSPNARAHLILAIIGAGVIFGASSIVSFIQSMVN